MGYLLRPFSRIPLSVDGAFAMPSASSDKRQLRGQRWRCFWERRVGGSDGWATENFLNTKPPRKTRCWESDYTTPMARKRDLFGSCLTPFKRAVSLGRLRISASVTRRESRTTARSRSCSRASGQPAAGERGEVACMTQDRYVGIGLDDHPFGAVAKLDSEGWRM